jgi:hypothetical protein
MIRTILLAAVLTIASAKTLRSTMRDSPAFDQTRLFEQYGLGSLGEVY